MNTLRLAASTLGVLTIAAIGWPLGCAAGSEAGPGSTPTGTGTPTAVGGAGGSGEGGGSGCLDEELCDGLDNDCDEDVDEDCDCVEGDTQECFSGDSNLIDVGLCAMGEQTCDIHGDWGDCEGEVLPVDEICNGEDEDCNGVADDGLNGTVTCGLGACEVTVPECENHAPVPCEPGQPNPTELCEGTDDDCDGDVDEDCDCVEDETQACYSYVATTRNVGECHDGLQTCDANGDWGPCQNDQGPTQELCDGLDNDCDVTTADGANDPAIDVPCDSAADSDLCTDGTMLCTLGSPVCNDTTPSVLDLCDGVDNDCNSGTADGEDETWFGVPCDGDDQDLCTGGTYGCSNNVQTCGDGNEDDPLCTSGQSGLGSVSGDTGSDEVTDTWHADAWDRVSITEDDSGLGAVYLSATVALYSPPGVDFDLRVYCSNCGSTYAGGSTTGGLTGHTDVVEVRNDDNQPHEDGFDIVVQIDFFDADACAAWELTVFGNTEVLVETCDL